MDELVPPAAPGTVEDARRERDPRAAKAPRRTIDARMEDGVDLAALSRNVAARLDAVLAARSAGRDGAGAAVETEQAVQAWSTVVARPTTHDGDEARREALATTVLRIASDGRVDVVGSDSDEDDPEAPLEAPAPPQGGPDEAPRPSRPAAAEVERRPESEAQRDATAPPIDAPPAAPPAAPVAGPPPGRPQRHGPGDPGLDQRLQAARQRLAMRRAAATGPRRDRPPLLQQRALRTTLQRLLIGAAIVGASAVVSILLT